MAPRWENRRQEHQTGASPTGCHALAKGVTGRRGQPARGHHFVRSADRAAVYPIRCGAGQPGRQQHVPLAMQDYREPPGHGKPVAARALIVPVNDRHWGHSCGGWEGPGKLLRRNPGSLIGKNR